MNPAVTVKENYVFRQLYRKGSSSVQPSFVVYCRKNKNGLSRLGVTVSTKLGKAVIRNRVRRRLRELYRLNKSEMKQGYDVILVGRSRAITAPFSKMQRQYAVALKELGLMEAHR